VGESREPENVALGRVIRKLREESGLSEDELARRAQLPVEDLRQIEAGDIDADWGALRQIAYGLETSLADLFRQAEEPEAG
jgi:transcriptional regulator with XRE-family HTH domain